MARLYVGGPVPGKRPVPNPTTVSGYPRLNTFQGLGIRSVTTDLRIQARAAGVTTGGGRAKGKKLDPSNLCHRTNDLDRVDSQYRKAYETARRLSLSLDRLAPDSPGFDLCAAEWGKAVRVLLDYRQHQRLRMLINMERARGQVRTQVALRRAGITLN